ncbi:MAG: hypothetical protein ACRD72_21200, partial [Candidatus Angelobacter sp.]
MLYRHPQFTHIYKRSWAIKKAWLAKRGFFRRLAYAASAACMLTSMAFINIAKLPIAHASSPYQASDVLGQPDFTTGRINAGGLASPASTALDSVHHRLFVADSSNDRVLTYNLDGNNNPIDRTADYVLGQSDFTTNNPATGQNGMYNPRGLSYDSTNQRLFVVDAYNQRVLIFDLSSGITDGMDASHVLGQANFTSNAPHYTGQKGLVDPEGVDYDQNSETLFVTNSVSNRVLIFDLSSGITDNMNASYVLGQSDFNGSDSGLNAHSLANPVALHYDATYKYLFVFESYTPR